MATKQHKRGLSLPLRAIVVGLLILLQIAIVIALVYILSVRVIWVYSVFSVLSMVLVIFILNRRGNSYYKTMWAVSILAFPLAGGIVYLIWGGNRIFPYIKKRLAESQKNQSKYLLQDSSVKSRLEYEDILHVRQSDYLRRDSGYPVYMNTSTEYLSPGEVFFPRFLEELEKAEKYIFIEFFILAEGIMWDSVHKILTRKAAQGVEVRIIFDDFGSITRQYRGFVKGLRAEGIKVSVFNPLRPSVDIFMNNRNHRKIVVIDGITAVTGGLNIGDEYINQIKKYGYWMDCAVIIKGEAVTSFVVMFCNMWRFANINSDNLDTGKYINSTSVINSGEGGNGGNGFVQPYCDSPLDDSNPAQGIYMQILNTSQRYVYITSPYLVLDDEMVMAISLAAKSGIDVRIVTPAKWDKWYVHPVTQYYYYDLLKAGVRIYEYTPGFIHSKLFVSDDSVATVATANLDFRSFYFHFECGAWICKNQTVLDIRDHIVEIIKQSKEIKIDEWVKRPIRMRIKQTVLHLFAPYL